MRTKVLLLLSALLLSLPLTAETLHEERSLYRDITVTQEGTRRCLVFNVHRGDRNQTCMNTADPERLVFEYAKMTFAGLLLKPEPQRILIAGLGGGSLPLTLTALYPDATIDVIEIDQAVVNVAKDYFGFAETDKVKVSVNDARVFVKRAGLLEQRYDFVILDAFTGDYIPEHLLTEEFLEEVRAIMAPEAVLVANTFSTSRFYDHESETYQQVFGEFFNFKLPSSGNRIIIARDTPLPARGELMVAARELSARVQRFGVPLLEYPNRLSTRIDWDRSRRVLTDQYSPSNLLRDN
ncbi:MAG: fused MFS/spermidine synthase [Gammaproteobacteria bacterium]|jgi:spermidine synthase|nr:fused MFS/spermidine synthase [Gammaproteobacteria bacterium]